MQLPNDVRVYVNGREHAGDVRTIELADGREIAVIIGAPPSVIPSEFPPGPR